MTFNLFPLRVVALVALLLVAVPRVSAEPIQWSYTGQITTTGPSTGYYGEPLGPHVLVSLDGKAIYPDNRVEFADVTGKGSGSTSVTAFQMRANTFFDGGPYPIFFKDIHTFNLGIGIRDAASGVTGTVSFQGMIQGYMRGEYSRGWVDLQVGFTGPTQKSLVLGDHLYKVNIDPFGFGFLQDLTSVKLPVVTPYQNVPINVQVSNVPEPSTLALAAAGLAGLGLRAWRRRSAHRRSSGPETATRQP
jgi:hypothetical protein